MFDPDQDAREDESRRAEDAIAAQQVEQQDTFQQLFEPIYLACVRHGKGIGEARVTALSVLETIVRCKPPDDLGLPPEDHDLFG